MHPVLEGISFLVETVRFVEAYFAEYGIIAHNTDFGYIPYADEAPEAKRCPITNIGHRHYAEQGGREIHWTSFISDLAEVQDEFFVCVALSFGPGRDSAAELYFNWHNGSTTVRLDFTSCERESPFTVALIERFRERLLSQGEQREVLGILARGFLGGETPAGRSN